MDANTLKIIFAGLQKDLIVEWQRLCTEDFPFVTVHQGSILEVSCKALVSPANSFGFMDGGIDRLYIEFFGQHVQERLQKKIRERHHGELLVGEATHVETGNRQIEYLIVAPTMRVPAVLGAETVNPYLAMRAVLLHWKYSVVRSFPFQSFVPSIAVPGFGTGVGQVPFAVCARQQFQAIRDVFLDEPAPPTSWQEAQERHQRLYTDHPRDLQQD